MARNYFQYVLGAQWGENEGEVITRKYGNDQGNEMMRLVAKMICFSDCTDERVTKIVYEGREIEYIGWRPGMYMAFRYTDNGELAYENCFPQWDH
jgi:hypothetical protein